MKPIKKGMTEAVNRDGRKVTCLAFFDGVEAGDECVAGVLDGSIELWYEDGIYLKDSSDSYDIFAPPEFEYQWLVKHKNDIIYDTTNHYKNEEDALAEWEDYTIVYLIHESRRECQS